MKRLKPFKGSSVYREDIKKSSKEILLVFLKDHERHKRSLQMIMTHHFRETTVTAGVDVNLQCVVNGLHPARFVWERDGVVISSNTDSRITLGQMMSADGVMSQLNISHVRVDDGGRYSCLAQHGDSIISHEDRVNVYGPPYIRALPPIKAQSGQSIVLKCPYYGFPIRDITWEFRGKEIIPDKHGNRYKRSKNIELSKEIYGRKPKLRKRDVSVNNDGVLYINKVSKAENGAAYACIVRSPSGEMAKRSFDLQVVEAPSLEEILLTSDLHEGQMVQIHCNLKSGDSPVYYSWLKDGKKIPSSLKVIIEIYLTVAPKWSEEPQNTSLLLGRNGHVSCRANGYPQPQTHWLKKDPGGGVLSLSNGSLIFDSVALSDAGLYTCHVENGVGEALSKTVWISVNKPVSFDTSSRNLTAKLGQEVVLECQAKGDDPIRMMWTRNGKPINPLTQRVKISEVKTEDGMTGILELLQTEPSDGALYQCKAGNPYGADVYSVHLTILEPPLPPSDLSVDAVKSRSVKLSWRDSTRSLAHYYTVQITNTLRPSWTTARIFNVTRLDDIRQSFDIEDLQPATGYTARVAGGNQADVSNYCTPVRFTTNEEAPVSPPLGVQVEQTESPGELRVRWLPPPSDSHNGMILGYKIRAVPQLTSVKVFSKQDTIITSLLKGVRYAVSVAAFNGADTGPYSIPIFEDTREGGRQWQNSTSPITEVRIQSLTKYTNYTVKVAGFSNYGVGPFSFPIVCSTLQDVPDAPSEIKLLSQSSTSLLVSWKKPRQPNGRLLHYTVYCKSTASTTAYDETHSLELKGLQEGRQYDVWVTASTVIGEGPETRRVTSVLQQKGIYIYHHLLNYLNNSYRQFHHLPLTGCGATQHTSTFNLVAGTTADTSDHTLQWGYDYRSSIRSVPSSYAVGSLQPSTWYQLRVTATNDAGVATTLYTYATKSLDGVLLVACLFAFICILFKRHRQTYTSQYRHSIEQVKSREESVASQSEHKERYAHAPRILTSPKTGKSETSFQTRSESDDSDSTSKATVAGMPRRLHENLSHIILNVNLIRFINVVIT
ncbi:unnamed protein product [Leptidea sinapis]|uniref:Down syndrome cell adhesion molecule n=1 Tax=Leptidea sinapis TaxID=189913 RepID=A0A5E4R1B3_9NEOP|nr:unnamed protein product [Leptidea sinapis]